MPRRDGTGPMGQGRLSGRGLGNCNTTEDNQNDGLGFIKRGLGQGSRLGKGMGQGAGSRTNAVSGCRRGGKGKRRCCENN